jgi:hypothetical protein
VIIGHLEALADLGARNGQMHASALEMVGGRAPNGLVTTGVHEAKKDV